MSEPASIGKYRIEGVLGQGGMGVVYRGFDPAIQRPVAVKTITKSALDPADLQYALTRFRHEAQAVGRLTHPRITAIYDYGAQRVAWVCSFVTNWMGDDAFLKRLWVSIRRFNIEGDALWHRGQVIEKRIVDGEYQVICDFWAENQLGEVTAPGQAVVLLPSRAGGHPQLPAKGQPEYPKWGPTTKLTPLGVEPLPPSTTHGFLPFGLMS